MVVNGIGAIATGLTVAVVLVAKFVAGAWITVLLIPTLDRPHGRDQSPFPIGGEGNRRNRAALRRTRFVNRWWSFRSTAGTRSAGRACDLPSAFRRKSKRSTSCSTRSRTNLPNPGHVWWKQPARAAGLPVPELVASARPFRYVVTPIVDYVLDLSAKNPDREIAVIVPELVEHKWYHYFLHNQRAEGLKALLLLKGNQRITTMNIPWYLKE